MNRPQTKMGIFSCSFVLRGRIKTNTTKVKERLSCLPNMKLVSYGTRLKYIVIEGEDKTSATFEAGPESLCMSFFFDEPSPLLYNKNMMKLLSILAFLEKDYEVDLTSLYVPIIEILHGFVLFKPDPKKGYAERLERQIKALSCSNNSIADRLIERERILEKTINDGEAYRQFCLSVLDYVKGISQNRGMAFANLNAIGVSDSNSAKIIRLLQYKM